MAVLSPAMLTKRFLEVRPKIIDTVLLLQIILTCVAGAEDFVSQNSDVGSAFNEFGGGRVDSGIVDETIYSGTG